MYPFGCDKEAVRPACRNEFYFEDKVVVLKCPGDHALLYHHFLQNLHKPPLPRLYEHHLQCQPGVGV